MPWNTSLTQGHTQCLKKKQIMLLTRFLLEIMFPLLRHIPNVVPTLEPMKKNLWCNPETFFSNNYTCTGKFSLRYIF